MTWDSVTKNAVNLTQQQVAAKAVEMNRAVMVKEPRPLGVKRYVDGVEGAPETAVRAGGVIVYDYNRLDLVAEVALDTLRQLSPVKEGNYVRGHVIMLNEQIVELAQLRGAYKDGDTITISNTEPYTRKIERGGKGFRTKGHVYEKAERILVRRFGNQASIYFTYRKAPAGAIHDWARSTGMSSTGHASANHRAEWLIRQPTLVIREL